MKAVISSTYDSKYLYFLPIVTFCWNRLGVDVICFMPEIKDFFKFESGILTEIDFDNDKRVKLINETMIHKGMKFSMPRFSAPEHKEATYAQCSRLYGACLDLPEDEVLIVGDIDMAVFNIGWLNNPIITGSDITIFGADLVPEKQVPMCYISGNVKEWRNVFELHNKTYQHCLDNLLGDIECENMRGNYWGKDQQTAFEMIDKNCSSAYYFDRARPNTQFADNRVDRDDTNWRAYVNDELIDAHLWRDGFTEQNHANIMELMRMKFPDEDFTWLENYRTEYLKLI